MKELKLIYVPAGNAEPSRILQAYQSFKSQNLLPYISWYEEWLPEAERGGERAFLQLWEDSDAVVLGREDQFYGVVWFNRHATFRAHISLCYCRKLATSLLTHCTHQAILKAHEMHGFEEVWGETPWPWIVRSCVRGGAKLMATIPDFVMALGKRRPLYMLRFDIKEIQGG